MTIPALQPINQYVRFYANHEYGYTMRELWKIIAEKERRDGGAVR